MERGRSCRGTGVKEIFRIPRPQGRSSAVRTRIAGIDRGLNKRRIGEARALKHHAHRGHIHKARRADLDAARGVGAVRGDVIKYFAAGRLDARESLALWHLNKISAANRTRGHLFERLFDEAAALDNF
jgi:hypothetical protein